MNKRNKYLTSWAKHLKLNKCLACGSNKNKHHSHGYCSKCYSKERYKTSAEYRLKKKEATYRWIKSHPEQWKIITTKATIKYQNKLK